MIPPTVDLCIVGAGAAGLAAGIFAAEQNPHLTIELLDGAKAIGAKILVSGGGGGGSAAGIQSHALEFQSHFCGRIFRRLLQL